MPEDPAGTGILSRQAQRELGRIAFESPALLGGAAARGELACSSCHVNGRGNMDFHLPGLSGEPGTADVTSSLFSKSRGDGVFNPVDIPDLAQRGGRLMRDRTSSAFREKVLGLIVEEFEGAPPPPRVFDWLLVYLQDNDAAHCADPGAVVPVAMDRDLEAVRLAIRMARVSAPGDEALFWSRVARLRLQEVHARHAGPELAEVRLGIVRLSRAIAAEQSGAGPEQTDRHMDQVAETARKAAPLSLYSPERLKAALAPEGS